MMKEESERYRMVITEDHDEGGYVVSFPDLPGCISEGETVDEAIRNASDAEKVWIETALEDGYAIPQPSFM